MKGRNDKCRCGSGKKFKHCCLDARGVRRPAGERMVQDLNSDVAAGLAYLGPLVDEARAAEGLPPEPMRLACMAQCTYCTRHFWSEIVDAVDPDLPAALAQELGRRVFTAGWQNVEDSRRPNGFGTACPECLSSGRRELAPHVSCLVEHTSLLRALPSGECEVREDG